MSFRVEQNHLKKVFQRLRFEGMISVMAPPLPSFGSSIGLILEDFPTDISYVLRNVKIKSFQLFYKIFLTINKFFK